MPRSPLTHDRVFRYVFGEPESLPLLESLINAYFKAAGLDPVQALAFLPRDLGPEAVEEKLTVLDVVARSLDGRMIDVEVQTTDELAFLERSLFYWARLYGRQLKEGKDYSRLNPVVCLNLMERPGRPTRLPIEVIRLPGSEHLALVMVDLVKLKDQVPEEETLKEAIIWSKFLEDPTPATAGETGHLAESINQARTRMEEFMALTPQVLREIRDEMIDHDRATLRENARRKGHEEGLEAGLKEGRQEGRQEGLQEGLQEGRLEGRQEGWIEAQSAVVRRMTASGFPRDQIRSATGLSDAEIAALLTV